MAQLGHNPPVHHNQTMTEIKPRAAGDRRSFRVLIYEPNPTGHHFDFLRLMLPAARALASHVIIGTSERGARSEQYRVLIAPELGAAQAGHRSASAGHDGHGPAPVTVDTGVSEQTPRSSGAGGKTNLVTRALALADEFVACVKRTQADHVLLPYADGLSQALALRRLMLRGTVANDRIDAPGSPGAVTSEALFMRGGIAYPAGSLKRALSLRASWMLMRRTPHNHRFHLDPLMHDWISRQHPKLVCREPGDGGWSLMPDPASNVEKLSRVEARQRLNIPREGLIVGAVGQMDTRKGIDLLIRAFTHARLPGEAKLLLVGKQDRTVGEMLRPGGEAEALVRAGRIITIDRFVEVHEIGWAISAMDLVVASHNRHIGSASIVIKAAAAGRPTLGSNFGWIETMVNRFGLGTTCNVADSAAFSESLERALPAAHAWKPGEAGRRFTAFHSEENFQASWGEFMRHRLGLPRQDDVIEWDWVQEAAEGRTSADGVQPGLEPQDRAPGVRTVNR